jgi:hypothetical protein
LSIEKAVELFRDWGFRVEEGPGDDEVTVILEGADHRCYCVYDMDRLPQIAAAALRVRQANGVSVERPFSARRVRAAMH